MFFQIVCELRQNLADLELIAAFGNQLGKHCRVIQIAGQKEAGRRDELIHPFNLFAQKRNQRKQIAV